MPDLYPMPDLFTTEELSEMVGDANSGVKSVALSNRIRKALLDCQLRINRETGELYTPEKVNWPWEDKKEA